MARVRVDQLLVERGLVDSRERARRLVMAGQVRSGTRVLVKPATMLGPEEPLEIISPDRYVSRGGHKLQAALESFGIDATGRRCLDIGASTGGFTDCLLQHGAATVLAVDVGRAQLHQKLRDDPRVTLIEHTNARDLPPLPPIDLFVVDVSFISVTKVLPSVARRVPASTPGVVLLKPQFELEASAIARGGIVKDEAARERAAAGFRSWCAANGWQIVAMVDCPVAGRDGNVEFLVHVLAPTATVAEC